MAAQVEEIRDGRAHAGESLRQLVRHDPPRFAGMPARKSLEETLLGVRVSP
jgi:hypothetical protein